MRKQPEHVIARIATVECSPTSRIEIALAFVRGMRVLEIRSFTRDDSSRAWRAAQRVCVDVPNLSAFVDAAARAERFVHLLFDDCPRCGDELDRDPWNKARTLERLTAPRRRRRHVR